MRIPANDKSTTVRLLVDQTVFRAGLKLLLDAEVDLHVLSVDEEVSADITLIDLADSNALDTLCASYKESRFITLSDHAEPDELTSILKAGARGVVVKTAHPASLLEAIRSVASGQRWLDPELQQMLMSTDRLRPSQSARWEALTDREREVAALVLAGSRYRAIAEQLLISEHTVRNHLRSIFSKLQITSRVELAPYVSMAQST